MVKEQIIKYKETHRGSRVLMSTLLGELDRVNKNPSDVQCIQIIKKMIQNNILCNETDENEILEKFLPKMLTESEIIDIIQSNNFTNIGLGMKYFKENHAGLYDGKIVSNLIKKQCQ